MMDFKVNGYWQIFHHFLTGGIGVEVGGGNVCDFLFVSMYTQGE